MALVKHTASTRTTHVAGVPALGACADGRVRQMVRRPKLRLERKVARVVAPQRHLDLLQDQWMLRSWKKGGNRCWEASLTLLNQVAASIDKAGKAEAGWLNNEHLMNLHFVAFNNIQCRKFWLTYSQQDSHNSSPPADWIFACVSTKGSPQGARSPCTRIRLNYCGPK